MNRRNILGLGAGAAIAAPLLAAAAAAAPQYPADYSIPRRRMLSVTDYGAVGDGKADDTAAIQKGIDVALNDGNSTFLQIPPGVYRITKTLVAQLSGVTTRQFGIIAHGARLESEIRNGTNVLEIYSSGTNRYLRLEGLDIRGNGAEGHGILVQWQQYWLYNMSIQDTVVQNCGGDGLRVLGDVFESRVVNCYFMNNMKNGATFGHGFNGGVFSAFYVFACTFEGNKQYGAEIVNWATDCSFHGCSFNRNASYGLHAKNGATSVANSSFVDNHMGAGSFASGGAAIYMPNFGTLVGCIGYSEFYQKYLIESYVVGSMNLIGCSVSGKGQAAGHKLGYFTWDAGRAQVNVIGCSGAIEGSAEVLQLGGDDAGAVFGSSWSSRTKTMLGNHTLWVDNAGRLRIKNGSPSWEADGTTVGGQA